VITPDNELVLQAWHFCQGWNPALIPAAAAFYDVRDLDFLVEQLLLVRDKLAEHRAQESGNA
jgi:hypothetical protein